MNAAPGQPSIPCGVCRTGIDATEEVTLPSGPVDICPACLVVVRFLNLLPTPA